MGNVPQWNATLCFFTVFRNQTCVTLQSGSSLPELMELGGWKSYGMVLRHAHLAPETLSSVSGRMERHLSKLDEAPAARRERSKKR